MGVLVEILKLENENSQFVYYEYQFSIQGEEYISASGRIRYRLKKVSGQLKLNKINGDIDIIKLADSDNNSFYASRACKALAKHWLKGEYPDITCWAS